MSTDADRPGLPEDLLTTIDHVGIAVPDLREAIAFYELAFGVHSVHEEINEEQGVHEAMLAVGDGETRIQLLAPLNENSTIAKFIGRSGPGLQQLAFRVDDVEAVSAILRERGLRLLYDVPKRGTASTSSTRNASCCRPGPERPMNLAIVESSFSGASSWMRVSPSPTASIASWTPCSSLTSSCTECTPKASS